MTYRSNRSSLTEALVTGQTNPADYFMQFLLHAQGVDRTVDHLTENGLIPEPFDGREAAKNELAEIERLWALTPDERQLQYEIAKSRAAGQRIRDDREAILEKQRLNDAVLLLYRTKFPAELVPIALRAIDFLQMIESTYTPAVRPAFPSSPDAWLQVRQEEARRDLAQATAMYEREKEAVDRTNHLLRLARETFAGTTDAE